MTDKQMQQLAQEYAELNPPADVKDEVLKRNLIGLNVEIFENFLLWLSSRYHIVPRDFIQNYHRICTENIEQRAEEVPERLEDGVETVAHWTFMYGHKFAMEEIFGKETFPERYVESPASVKDGIYHGEDALLKPLNNK